MGGEACRTSGPGAGKGMTTTSLVSLEECCLMPLAEVHLALVLKWRNSERIRRVMFSNHVIAEDEHRRWFASLQKDSNKDYQVLLYRQSPAGLSCLTNIDRTAQQAEWGFYTSPEYSLKGLGRALGYLAMERAFKSLNLSMVYTNTFAFNVVALRFQEKLGFIQLPGNHEHFHRDGRDQEVHRLELTRDRWQEAHR